MSDLLTSGSDYAKAFKAFMERLEKVSEKEVGDGLTVKDYLDLVKTFSTDFAAAGKEQIRETTFNRLMSYGVPKQPHEVWELIDALWFSSIAWAVLTGHATLTDKALRAEGEEEVHTVVDQLMALVNPAEDAEAIGTVEPAARGYQYL